MLKKAVVASALLVAGIGTASACQYNKSAQTPVPPVAEAPAQTPAPTLATAPDVTPVPHDVAQAETAKPESPKAN